MKWLRRHRARIMTYCGAAITAIGLVNLPGDILAWWRLIFGMTNWLFDLFFDKPLPILAILVGIGMMIAANLQAFKDWIALVSPFTRDELAVVSRVMKGGKLPEAVRLTGVIQSGATTALDISLTTTKDNVTEPADLRGGRATFSVAQNERTIIKKKMAVIHDARSGVVVLPLSVKETKKFQEGEVHIDIQVEFPSGEVRIWGPLSCAVRKPIE